MLRYIRWLGRRLQGRPRSRTVFMPGGGPARIIPGAVDPRKLQPPLPDFGLDLETLRDRFADISVDGSPRGELAGYARQDLERFIRTVDLVPTDARTGVEIGGCPYFTTTLLRWYRPGLELTITNFFGGEPASVSAQSVSVEGPAGMEDRSVPYVSLNVELDRFPFDDASLDVVLYCEVLEHMTNDPMASLLEIARVLKPGGTLVLTTPNVARIENVSRAIAGVNTQDQYSAYGPYGRHNREYTVQEVRALLYSCGFDEELLYTADVHDNRAALLIDRPNCLSDLCGHRTGQLGQYIFSRWRRSGRSPGTGKPAWLYRSYPPELVNNAPL